MELKEALSFKYIPPNWMTTTGAYEHLFGVLRVPTGAPHPPRHTHAPWVDSMFCWG